MNRNPSFSVVAIIIATALTFFSCSGDGNGKDDDSGGNSGGNEISSPVKKSKISGVSQKGPFVEGSTATLYELNKDFEQTGRSFRSVITDNKGTFEIRNIELVSQFAMLEASGYYRNENTGKISESTISLFAIADAQEKDQVNVNILTHLEYYRVLNLVENEGMSVKEAKKQAQKEIFEVFGINNDAFKDSEDMSIFSISESDAALLAISILLQSNLSEGEFLQRLTNFSQAIRTGGVWSDNAAKTAIADWASGANLLDIRSKMLGWGLASDVPNFEKYVRDYWAANYGLGECNSSSNGVMKQNANANSSKRASHYICNGSYWESTSPMLICSNFSSKGYAGIAVEEPVLSCSVGELSNPSWTSALVWANPAKGTYYVNATATCGSAAGLTASCGSLNVIDQPTLSCSMPISTGVADVAVTQPTPTCSDGSMPFDIALKGDLPNWSNPAEGTYAVNVEANCGVEMLNVSCGTLTIEPVKLTCNSDNVSGVAGTAITDRPYLSCNNNQTASNPVWENAPDWNNPAMGDYGDMTVTASCGSEANLRADCSGTLTVACTANDNTSTQYCSVGVMKNYGFVKDNAGNTYKTVVIGKQTWMAENLNYNTEGSECYDNDPANCEGYGRLYDWATAMDLDQSCNTEKCVSKIQSPYHQGICPENWHLPSDDEWITLINYVSGIKALKAINVWYNSYGGGDDTDDYGFSALPISYAGSIGYLWSSTEANSSAVWMRRVYEYYAERLDYGKSARISVRCLQD